MVNIISADETFRDFVTSRYELDFLVADMDAASNTLFSSDGVGFREVHPNIWMHPGADCAYLGTGRHGGGITLRLLYVRFNDAWVNVETGRRAPFEEGVFNS